MKIAIDKGHNKGRDQGAVAIGNENVMNIQTGDKVISYLQSLGHETLDIIAQITSVSSINDSLNQRVNLANSWGADLYVSIHANAAPGGTGVEVWIGSESTRAIANTICDKVASAFGYKNRGSKLQGLDGRHLAVLNNTRMPALLVEQCFVDCDDDMNKWNPDIMAKCIVEGITDKSIIVSSIPTINNVSKYDESAPTGSNIWQIPGMPFYIEKRYDGDMAIHLDRGNYITLRKGGAPEVYWNNNKGSGGSKRLF